VRLYSRNGYDWSDRYPWIVEAALKNRQQHFAIDGEAVLLGVDGISEFQRAAILASSDDEVQLLCPSTSWRSRARICGSCPCTFARIISRGYWRGGRREYS